MAPQKVSGVLHYCSNETTTYLKHDYIRPQNVERVTIKD